MKIKELTVSRTGVIPGGAYENLRPGYSMTLELADGDDHKAVMTEANEYLRMVFDAEANAAKTDLIASLYAGIRFYEKDGRKYPSVTSILFYGKDFHMAEHELAQYAARGTIVGEMVEAYLTRCDPLDDWIYPDEIECLKEDVATLLNGSLNMHWDQCAYKAFVKQFSDKIDVDKIQGVVFNDEHLYAGTYDILGLYDKKKAIMDCKCGGYDMRQLAAYAMCLKDVDRCVVLPVGPTDNKCGYKKPVICDAVQKEFEGFLKARAKFRSRFGI